MSRWEQREAARIGNNRAIDDAEDHEAEQIADRARIIREENIRRTKAAS